ncbi:MAG: SpoIIE family protein phosphatase, partial [Candidatus Riflebacteria bacterium]|nr:SpoIIE family protein phosphatase [Candidatus Riflebacteria bacterium]
QLNFVEITNELMTNVDDIKPWGFEKNINMTYFKFFPVHTPDKLDYAVVCLWLGNRLQGDFLKTSLLDANRNANNIKVVAYNLASREFFGNVKDENDVLLDYVKKTGKSQSEEIETINYNGQDYVAVAFNGEYLNAYRLIGLYPIKNIEQIIGKQKTDMMLYVLLNIALAISLAQILAKSFLEPLSELRKGAIAIENRDFSHRITNLDKDEFGEVGNIFNNIMVGLAEVETAKVVQESLFPKENFFHNSIAVYGKSIAMSGIGGDYIDYFKIDDRYFAALIGDVAGHGIGAALIMAMAKAGILCSAEYQNSPGKILNLLHQLILQAKNKQQRKIMTFQYAVFDSQIGEALYANAGGCSPYIYRKKTNIVEELKFTSPVLGAFKKTVYSEKSFNFEQGDAVIFYSDGIIESRNTAGEELGYSQFQKIIIDSYDIDPALFYKNLYEKYKIHTENQDLEDDMTLMILVYNNEHVIDDAEKDKNGTQII